MLRYALIYGVLSGLVTLTTIVLAMTLGEGAFSHSVTLGYLIMLVVLSLLFVGVKRYRDVENGGTIRFGQALGLGLAIAVVAGLAYVLAWEAYLAMTDYAFMEEYSAEMIASIRAAGGADAAAKIAEIEAMTVAYQNPLFRIGITFLEIFPVGLVVALVSALLLKNPRFLPARRAA